MRASRLALVLALVAGCAPQTTSVPPTTAPSASPSAAASAPVANPSGRPGAGLLPSVTVRGTVYDEAGQVLRDGATVRAVSLNPSNPFEQEVPATDGRYELSGIPAGVQFRLTAAKPGWTSRSRLEVLTTDQTLDFGALTDVSSAPYGLSNYPEIVSIEPGLDKPVANTMQVKVTLSEPLDLTNRLRFARALRVIPANEYAASGLSRPRDISQEENVELPATAWPYAIGEGATLDDTFETRATVTWDAEGRVATFNLPAPLLTSDKDAATYNVVVVAKATEKIVDGEGLPLGTNVEGKRGTTPSADGVIIENAFLKPALTLSAADLTASPERRWALLHVPAARFTLMEDDTPPRLVGVSAGSSEGDTRILLRFSEPLAAFDGTKEGRRDAGLTGLPRYTFIIGKSADEVESKELRGESTVSASADTTGFERTSEFELSPAAENPIEVELDPSEPSVLRLILKDNPSFFASTIRAIKARAESIQDPAGNRLSEDEADSNTVTGPVSAR